ncbi:helix-turn-helix domain-containing protein [Streptomyces sp. NPDC057375]|uniref:helix-turn-helix domain-containing protein n=1 Tax=Streptomyces sp. NPDC057375 TaxID=3346109 RepID=UPI003635D117
MLTLRYLTDTRPDLRLRWVDPEHARLYADTRVTEVTTVAPAMEQGINSYRFSASGTLVLVNLSGGVNERIATALNQLMDYLKYCRAAGLVLRVPERETEVNSSVRARADRFRVPLLTTTADTEWVGVNEFLQQQRATFAERQVERLEGLLNRMPTQLANGHTVDAIVTWLATALEADVVIGSADQGVLAAAPDTETNLARALVDTSSGAQAGPAEHTRLVQIFGAGDNTMLAIASHGGFDMAAGRLLRHAAKLLGLCEQARHDYQTAVLGPRSVSQAATQLFLSAEAVKGQMVANTLAPALMDTEHACVRIIDTGERDREPTLRWCERNLSSRALVAPCPGKPRRITIITPTHHQEGVASDLRAMIRTRDWLVMGESRPHSLPHIGAAHDEAAQALRAAALAPERVSVGAQSKVAPLLPWGPAHAWAQALLSPILQPAHRQLLETLSIGCSVKPSEAARALGIHRNTLRQRLARAGCLLSLDLNTVNDRILVLLAVDILALPALEEAGPTPVPDLSELLAPMNGAVRDWAENRLRPLDSDHRELLRTLCVWFENDLSVRLTALNLGVSEATVRHHTSDACALLGTAMGTNEASPHDTDVVTIADIGIAAHVVTGTPSLRQPGHGRPPTGLSSAASPGWRPATSRPRSGAGALQRHGGY